MFLAALPTLPRVFIVSQCARMLQRSPAQYWKKKNVHPFVELSLRLKYPVYNKGPKLMRNNRDVVGQVMYIKALYFTSWLYSHRDAV